MIRYIKFKLFILVTLQLFLSSCGCPQIVTYPALNYSRNEYESAFQEIWEKYPEYRIRYSEILNFKNAFIKPPFFENFNSELGIDSLTHNEVEYRMFHNMSLYPPYEWMLKSNDKNIWYAIRLIHRINNKSSDCILGLTYVWRDNKNNVESVGNLKKRERMEVVDKFEKDLLILIKDLINKERNKNAL